MTKGTDIMAKLDAEPEPAKTMSADGLEKCSPVSAERPGNMAASAGVVRIIGRNFVFTARFARVSDGRIISELSPASAFEPTVISPSSVNPSWVPFGEMTRLRGLSSDRACSMPAAQGVASGRHRLADPSFV